MSLGKIQKAILEGFNSIDGISSASLTPRRSDQFATPAIFLELNELESGKDSGTGELGLIAHWEARLIISEKPNELAAWSLLEKMLYWLFDNDWPPINVGRPRIKQATPDNFTPTLQGHRVWLVEWTQDMRIGENVWAETEPVEIDKIVVRWNGKCEEEFDL